MSPPVPRRRMPGAEPPEPPADEPTPRKRSRRPGLPSGFATVRDVVCFVFGAVIVANEVFLSKTAEAAAIGVGVAFCGLPLVFGADEKSDKQ